ncbi:hypothetical protein [Streptomyces cyaneofuscatus]|uniref:Carrier domain-containing protein n=1 Tax=Streptomyces cyaneofuscatus TaxID=66883 RepID=A0ABZ1EW38_9ACTN|nr:hypothetical protein [Streptomyces cyaneofuscatus]WSB08280.1 hypothetical protein OG849_13955 [Streptomyces cyaneofuscatus]WSD48187.1 hypothetical protein OG857_21450 [Streptomyces cyaneofuscatus]WTA91560.1 hypothetical protein OG323_22425 [Streptomyces cyaneofuscatus]
MSSGTEEQSESQNAVVRNHIRRMVADLSPLKGLPEALPDQALREELGYDSVRQVELTFLLEELFAFDSQVIDGAPPLETVSDLENFTLDAISKGQAKVPSPSDIDRARKLIPDQ